MVLWWWGMFPKTLWCCVSSRYSKNTRFYQLTWWSKLATAESFHVLIISPSSEQRHKYKLNWLFCKFPISNMHLTRHLIQATLLLLLLNKCLLHIHVLCSFDTLGIWPLRLQKTAKNFDDALLLSFVGQSRYSNWFFRLWFDSKKIFTSCVNVLHICTCTCKCIVQFISGHQRKLTRRWRNTRTNNEGLPTAG